VTNLVTTSHILTHSLNQVVVGQRAQDGYINGTAMCQAANKRMGNYLQNQETQAVLAELSRSAGIPADLLVQTITTGSNEQRGTWVYPDVAIHLAMWCSPTFAVQVLNWVKFWLQTQHHPIAPAATDPIRIKIENFTAIIQLRERLGMKVDRNVHLAIEALQGQAIDLPVVTLKERDLHYAERFWGEKHKEGWRTQYSTNETMVNQLGRYASRICRERGIQREENLQVIQSNNRLVDVGLYPWAILEEAFRYLIANGKAYRADERATPALYH
jgi:hypothetical protein